MPSNNKGITKKQLEEILNKFLCFSDGNNEVLEEFADKIEEYFDELMCDDYFGTEGQCHPFGDKRDC